jgi:putative radical SAM enzyme (TIGR03279 family)
VVKITDVLPRSRAAKVGIEAGDILVSINGKEINDVLDYRFHLANREIDIEIIRNDTALSLHIKKQEYDDIGLDFETPLMDKKHSCENKCVFCFIDQLPRGMRKTLYFKDDDSRLSFLHGNYVTLTNMQDRDIQRIIDMHISPVNVSVHTTNPELRVKMMHNKRAGDVLKYLKMLADAGISLCCQIVLCRGINDGEELDRSLHDLVSLYPAVQSVAIVPAGLTKFREKLYPLEPFTPEECASVIKQINAFGDWCKKQYGTRLFYPSDEFYIKSGTPLPDNDFYEDYSQIENGVGMLTDMKTGVDFELEDFTEDYKESFRAPRTVSVVTGYAAYDHISELSKKLEAEFEGLTVKVYPIKNNFFGELITVAGLLTGKDMREQLEGKELGDELLIPSVTLRAEGDLFLDDISPEELSASLGGIKITPTGSDPCEFISNILGIEQ